MTSSFSKFVPFGTAMPKSGIAKFSAKVGDTRIRILSVAEGDFLVTKTHYLKGVGSFHCFEGSCCSVCANAPEGESNTQERAILPIAVASASIAGGVTTEYAYLALPETKYSQLLSLHQNVGDVTQYDILIQCTDEKYQKYTLLPLINQPSAVLSTQEQVNKASSFLALYRTTIMAQLGKTLDETSFQAARAKSLQQAAGAVGVQFTPNPTANQAFAQPQPMPALPTMNVQPQIAPAVTPQPTVTPVANGVQVAPPVMEVAQQTVNPVTEVVPQIVPPVVEVSQPVIETVATPVVETVQPVVEPTVAQTTPVVEAQANAEAQTTEINWADFMNN